MLLKSMMATAFGRAGACRSARIRLKDADEKYDSDSGRQGRSVGQPGVG